MTPPPSSLPPSAPGTRRDFVRASALGAAGLALTGPLCGEAAPSPAAGSAAPAGDADLFARRAADFLAQVLDVAGGPGGLLISHSDFDTRRPLQEGDVAPELHQVLDSVWGKVSPKPTVADWYYGENTAWATGSVLWSQMLRYRVTGDPEALRLARKCFLDLNHIFDLCRAFEPGLMGKPHGGRGGPTTSFDQSANPILHYLHFAQHLATDAEREVARRNLRDHGDYYLRRNWVMNHHGNFTRIVDRPHPSATKYFACVHAAFDLTGETRFRDAAVAQVREVIAAGRFPWPGKRYELNFNLFYYAWLGEYWLTTSLANDADWLGHMRLYWEAAQKGLGDDGLLLDGIYDTERREFTPVKEGWEDRSPPSAGSNATARRWWRSPTGYQGRTLYSLGVAILGLMVTKHGIDPKGHEVSRRILRRIDRSGLRQCWDDGRLPTEMTPFANLFGAEFPALWMIAYWMGREQKLW